MACPVTRIIARFMLEGPAHRAGARALHRDLARGLERLPARFERPRDRAQAERVLRHIIGIERWGQRRLRVSLGDEPFVRDRYHPYAPDEHQSLDALVGALRTTRQETIALARRIADSDAGGVRVEHNALGPITALGWLRYLRLHGDLEARRVRSVRA